MYARTTERSSQARLCDSTPGAPGRRPPLPHTITQVLKTPRSAPCLPLEPPLLPSGHQRQRPPLYTLAPHGLASAFACFPPFWQFLLLRDSWVRQSLPPRAGYPGYASSTALNYRRRCVGRAGTPQGQVPANALNGGGEGVPLAFPRPLELPLAGLPAPDVPCPPSSIFEKRSVTLLQCSSQLVTLPPDSSVAPTCPQLKLSDYAGQEALAAWLCLFSSLICTPPVHGDSKPRVGKLFCIRDN